MMSESVTVTVHDGQGNPRQQPGNKPETGQPVLLEGVSLNVPYFKSLPGIVKVLQLVFGIICIACASGSHRAGGSWFVFVAIIAFIMSMIWSLIYLFSIREALNLPINWLLTELFNTAIHTLLYFTAFVAMLASADYASQVVAGIFGLFNTAAYAAGTYFLYLEYKNSIQ